MENKEKKLEMYICEKIKKDIALNNFRKSYKSLHNKKLLITIKRIILSFLSLLGIGGISVITYANIYFKPVDYMDISYALIQDAVDNGYIDNIDMSYVDSNGIKLKINSLVVTDDKIDIVFDFEFDEKRIPEDKMNIAMIIYDEEKNLYYDWHTYGNNLKNEWYQKKFYKEKGLSKENYINASIGMNTLYQSANKYTGELVMNSSEKYPHAKKLYINIYDIGYNDSKDEWRYKSLYNINWSFEIEIPEQFYNRESFSYYLENDVESEDFVFEGLNITETGAVLTYKHKNSTSLHLSIIDENGKAYSSSGGILVNEKDNMYQYKEKYELNKYLATEKLYIYIEQYNITLELKKD